MADLDSALEAELVRLARETRALTAAPARDRAVILAGGRGRRLEPYTSVLPKPLMPIGNRSILEILVNQLADAGFHNLTFCVGYLSHLIRAVFENGPGSRVEHRLGQGARRRSARPARCGSCQISTRRSS